MSDGGSDGPGPRGGEFPGTDLSRLAVEVWRHSARAGEVPVQGSSMEPTLAEGARVWFRPLGGRRPRRGDMLLYLDRSRLVVHRVVGLHRDGRLRTKGDGRATFDARPTSCDAVIGRVVHVERGGTEYSLEGRGASAYARSLAAVSGLAGRASGVARLADRLLGRVLRLRSGRRPLTTLVGLTARVLLRLADRTLFPLLHVRRPAPAECIAVASGAPEDLSSDRASREGPSAGGTPRVE